MNNHSALKLAYQLSGWLETVLSRHGLDKYLYGHLIVLTNHTLSLFFLRSFFRLEWVQSFKVVDENEDCDVRHLEIICKSGSVPRNAEIIKIFGEDILPFITYKKSEFFNLKIGVHTRPCIRIKVS